MIFLRWEAFGKNALFYYDEELENYGRSYQEFNNVRFEQIINYD